MDLQKTMGDMEVCYVHLSGPFCPHLRHSRQVGIDDLPESSRMSAYRAYL